MSVYPIRHGETEWSLNGRHTGVTDLPLTANGRRLAAALKPVLAKRTYSLVLVSPMQRARETCELAGLGEAAIVEPDLMEWNYGDYEGLTTDQIQAQRPGWLIFRDGCPNGETPDEVGARADRVIARARAAQDDVSGGHAALFGHGHILRVLAARWIELPPAGGAHFLLGTGTLCVLGRYRDTPAIDTWNGPLDL
ncbi:MAG TPA: histidine phosphatase family protein [Caulobacteraceae bacterium]|nr:histidine phosphatase family protein [Caulobacteraceae bacterium]